MKEGITKKKANARVEEVYAAMEQERKYLEATEPEFRRILWRKIMIAVLLMVLGFGLAILSLVLK